MSDKRTTYKKGIAYTLEARLMLDAAAVATGAEVVAEAEGQQEAEALLEDFQISQVQVEEQNSIEALLTAVSEPVELQGKALVIIDGAVEDVETLKAGISSGTEVFVLDGQTDGLAQIAQIVAEQQNVASLHIVSHGDSGSLSLGEGQINFSALTQAQEEALASIGGGLLSGADILVYGCDFGSGERGRNAVETFASLTGADIAASDDTTGSVRLSADWDMEQQVGAIETAVVFDAVAQSNFSVTLLESYYTNSDTNADWSAGTTSDTDKWIKKTTVAESTSTLIDTKGKVKFADDDTGTYSVSFNIVDDDVGDTANTASEMIIGFTRDSETQPGATDYAAGTTSIDFGIYYDSGEAYAFVNGSLTDLVALGDDEANYKIEVDESTGVISFYGGAAEPVTSNGDFNTAYTIENGDDYVLDMDIAGAGDGFDNILLTNHTASLAAATGTFAPDGADELGISGETITAQGTKGADAGDLNNDGFNDVVVAEHGGNIAVYFNDQDGTFTRSTAQTFTHDGTAHSQKYKDVEIADLDGDGDLDIVAVAYGNTGYDAAITFGVNDGEGVFSWNDFEFASTTTNAIRYVNSVVAGNFDGDSDNKTLDVAITDGKNARVVVFEDVMSTADTVTIAGVAGSTTAVGSITTYTTNTNLIDTTDKPYVLEVIKGSASQDFVIAGTRATDGKGRIFLTNHNSIITGGNWMEDDDSHVLDLEVVQDSTGYGYVAAVTRTGGTTDDSRVYAWRIDSVSATAVTKTDYVSDTGGYINTTLVKPRAVTFVNIDGDDDLDLLVASSTSIKAKTYLNGDATGQAEFSIIDEADYAGAAAQAADLVSANLDGANHGDIEDEGVSQASFSQSTLFSGGGTIESVRNVFDDTVYQDRFSLSDKFETKVISRDTTTTTFGSGAGSLRADISGIETGDKLEFGSDSFDLDGSTSTGIFGVYSYNVQGGVLSIGLTSGTAMTSAQLHTLLDGLKFTTTSTTEGERVFEYRNDSSTTIFAETRIRVVS